MTITPGMIGVVIIWIVVLAIVWWNMNRRAEKLVTPIPQCSPSRSNQTTGRVIKPPRNSYQLTRTDFPTRSRLRLPGFQEHADEKTKKKERVK